MDLLTASHSSYPRIGNGPDEQALRRAITLREQGRGTDDDVRAAEDQLVSLALQDQEGAGLDIVTDGLIRWNDPASHLAAKLDGVRINGLIRYFDTNFYVRQPLIEGKITRRSPLVLDEFRWAAQRSTKPAKAVLTGPCTLARLSLKERGGEPVDLGSLALAYAEVLGAEVADLAAAGARIIQIDEPCLVKYPSDLALAREALTFVADRKGDAELGLSTYFGDAAPGLMPTRSPCGFARFGLYLLRELPEVIETNGSAKPLGLGLIDGS